MYINRRFYWSYGVFEATVAPSSGRNPPAVTGTRDRGRTEKPKPGAGRLKTPLFGFTSDMHRVFRARVDVHAGCRGVCPRRWQSLPGSCFPDCRCGDRVEVFLGSGPALIVSLLFRCIHVSLTCGSLCAPLIVSRLLVPRPWFFYWTCIDLFPYLFLFWICLPWIRPPFDSKSPDGLRFWLHLYLSVFILVPDLKNSTG